MYTHGGRDWVDHELIGMLQSWMEQTNFFVTCSHGKHVTEFPAFSTCSKRLGHVLKRFFFLLCSFHPRGGPPEITNCGISAP